MQIQLGPWQQTPDQIDRKRGHEHFLKTRQQQCTDEKISDAIASAELLISDAEDLRMGKLLAEREAKYWSMETAMTLSVNELNVRERSGEIAADAIELERTLSRKKLREIHSQQRAETLHMIRSEKESKGREKFETLLLGMQTVQALNVPPAPKFQNGASVIQWWASWMGTATEPLKTYNNKNRPAWFKGECLQHLGFKSVFYAGTQQSIGHVYQVY